MKTRFAALIVAGLLVSTLAGAEPKAPSVSILLRDRHSQVVPIRKGTAFSGAGVIDVQQPAADTVIVTMTGGVVASDHPCGSATQMDFDLDQHFEVVLEQPETKNVKLILEGRVIGALRTGRKGSASESGGCATIGGPNSVMLSLPDRAPACGESLSVNDKSGPVEIPAAAGPNSVHIVWHLEASHPKALLGKSASAEFAPEPALDPLWVGGPRDPFHGAPKKDFGFQITVRVAGEAPPAPKTASRDRSP